MPKYIPKRNENVYPHRNLGTNVYSSIDHNSQMVETAKCPLLDEWLNKLLYTHTMKSYSAIKKNKVLKCVTTWWTLKTLHWINF